MRYIQRLRPTLALSLTRRDGLTFQVGLDCYLTNSGTSSAKDSEQPDAPSQRVAARRSRTTEAQVTPPHLSSKRAKLLDWLMVARLLPRQERHIITRQMLARLFIRDTDFDAFCLTYFPLIRKNFSSAMDRTQRETMLLEQTKPLTILKSLHRSCKRQFVLTFLSYTAKYLCLHP